MPMPDEKTPDDSTAPMDAAHARVHDLAASQRATADVISDTRARVVAANVPDYRLPPTVILALRFDADTGADEWTLFDNASGFSPIGAAMKGTSRQLVAPRSTPDMNAFLASIGVDGDVRDSPLRVEVLGEWWRRGELSVPLAARERENPAVRAFAESQKRADARESIKIDPAELSAMSRRSACIVEDIEGDDARRAQNHATRTLAALEQQAEALGRIAVATEKLTGQMEELLNQMAQRT